MMRPSLMSGIDTLLKGLDAEALDGFQEGLVRSLAQLEICRHDLLDDVRDLSVGDSRSEQGAKLRPLIGAPTKCDLVEFLAVLFHPQYADMADVMVPTGIDAARDVDVQPAEFAGEPKVAETTRQLLGDWDGARIGEAAVVQSRARDNVGNEADVRSRHPDSIERAPQFAEIALCHMREHEVLLVADPNFPE